MRDLDGAGGNVGRFGGVMEVNERGEMGDFPGNERHHKGTRTAPEVETGTRKASNSLKTNGAVVAELADAPA
jgi:hypothetical protein